MTKSSITNSLRNWVRKYLSPMWGMIRKDWEKVSKPIRQKTALWLIRTFTPDPDYYYTKLANYYVFTLMKKADLFCRPEGEYVNEVLKAFESEGLSLLFLNETLQMLQKPTVTEHSVISRETWEQMFPYIVVGLHKSKKK